MPIFSKPDNLVMGGAARDIGRDENVRRAYLGY